MLTVLMMGLSMGTAQAADGRAELDALRAARFLDLHVLCDLKDEAACAQVEGRDEARDRTTACVGVARLMVARQGLGATFTANDDGNLLMVDAGRFLPRVCEGQTAMLDELAARVDHGSRWSVEGYAEVAEAARPQGAEACGAWAELVTTWPGDPEGDLFTRVRLGHVSACGDTKTIRKVFGKGLDESATGLTFLGFALDQAGKKAEACEVFTRAAAIDKRAHAGNIFETAELGRARTCRSTP